MCVCVCVLYILWDSLIHSPADGHLGYFHILAVMNSAVMNICVQIFCKILTVFPLDICPEVVLVNYMATLFLIFEEPHQHLFSFAILIIAILTHFSETF